MLLHGLKLCPPPVSASLRLLPQALERDCRLLSVTAGAEHAGCRRTSLQAARLRMPQSIVAGRRTLLQVARLSQAAEHRCRSQNIAAGCRVVAGCISSSSLLVGRNESTGREAWRGQHATKPHASLPWQTQHSQSRARSVGFVPCLASPCLAQSRHLFMSPPSRAGRDHDHCDPLFAFSLNPEMQRIHNQRSVQCTGDRDGRQETPMGATAPSERPL